MRDAVRLKKEAYTLQACGSLEAADRYQRAKRCAAVAVTEARVLERRVRSIVEPQIEEEQCGFRPGRGTVD